MYVALLVLHLLICLALIGVVLVQSGKGGGLAGGAFGGSAQTVFGGRGATDFITRATMILGGLFFATSLVLALMSSGLGVRARSVLQSESRTQAPTQPGQVPGRAPANAPSTTPPAGTAPAPTPTTPPATPPAPPPSSGGR
jgi:preprotein translocase subunit SecG